MLLLLHRRVIFLLVLIFYFELDEDYNIYEYDSDNDLLGLTQEPSQTQEVYGDKSENEANGENYRLLLKSAADLANLCGNQTCDFEDHIIGIMESDAEEEQLKIADLEPQPIEKPKNTMPSSTASSTVSS